MKIINKNNLEQLSLPLDIFNSIYIADAISRDDEKFKIFLGLEKKYVGQLIELSSNKNDFELQNNTKDIKRFSEGLYDDWYKKNRTPICLIHEKTDKLAALVWFGPENLLNDKNDWHTMAWRSYIPFRGKGLMKEFSSFAINCYLKYFPNICIWISLKRQNTGSQKLASSLGFKLLEDKSDNVSLVMAKY